MSAGRKPRLYSKADHPVMLPQAVRSALRPQHHNQFNIIICATTKVEALALLEDRKAWPRPAEYKVADMRAPMHAAFETAGLATQGRVFAWNLDCHTGDPVIEILPDGSATVIATWNGIGYGCSLDVIAAHAE